MMIADVSRSSGLAGIAIAAILLTACQSSAPPAPSVGRAALPTMERVTIAANACWFKSGDPAFTSYRIAPELNSFSGRPRFLIVPRNSPESRPLAVVQAEGNPAKLSAFGPLFDQPTGTRMSRDINRWASGAKGC